jgi:hypothetical protein
VVGLALLLPSPLSSLAVEVAWLATQLLPLNFVGETLEARAGRYEYAFWGEEETGEDG